MAHKNPPKKRDNTAARIIKALEETQGLLTAAAKRAGVSYSTIKRYVADYPSVAQAKEEAQERLLDFAEGKLYQKIKDGDTASLIFYLKTQGKKRGYVERVENTGKDGGPIEIKDDGKSKLVSAIARLASRTGENSGNK
ncbi:MAG: hypothetical protein PHH57_08045 [Candidatus Omnitrophica bacterium]|nr:hypothetical protein [Candidatus Omnitrophota bacterium]